MVEQVKRLLRLLLPIDWLAAGVVLLGVAIALFLQDAPVRLIGVSVALLGALAFLLLLSQRLGAAETYNPQLRSEAAQLRATVQQERGGRRLIFDDFAESLEEAPREEPATAEQPEQASSFEEELSSVRVVERRRRVAALPAQPAETTPAPPAVRIRSYALPPNLLLPSPATPSEPRQALHALLERFLELLRLVTPTRTAVLFWLDSEQGCLVLEAYHSESDALHTERRKFPLGQDIVSQLVQQGKAEIVTEIHPAAEAELFPYYREPVGTACFVGVPVFFRGAVIGALCLDSAQPGAYSPQTVTLLGHAVRFIGEVLEGYLRWYEMLQRSSAAEALERTLEAEELEPALLELLRFPSAAVVVLCCYVARQRGWQLVAADAPPAWKQLQGRWSTLQGSLVGAAIHTGTVQYWDPRVFRHRVLAQEEPPLAPTAAAWAVPLCSSTHCYGVVYYEAAQRPTPQEEQELLRRARWAGLLLEHRYLREQVGSGLQWLPGVELWSSTGFRMRINEELERVRTLQYPATLALLQIDRYGTLAQLTVAEIRELLTGHVLPLLRTQLRGGALVGYADEETLGVLLPGMSAVQARLWAEALRKQVATAVAPVGERRLNLTLSIGLVELQPDKTSEEMLRAAHTALQRALSRGNTVTVFA